MPGVVVGGESSPGLAFLLTCSSKIESWRSCPPVALRGGLGGTVGFFTVETGIVFSTSGCELDDAASGFAVAKGGDKSIELIVSSTVGKSGPEDDAGAAVGETAGRTSGGGFAATICAGASS